MKKHLPKYLSGTALIILTILPFMSNGQNFIPPNAFNYTYDGGLGNSTNNVRQVNNYSETELPTGFGPVDLYLSSWTTLSGGGEFVWQFTAPTDPTVIFNKGTKHYNSNNMAVGAVHDQFTGATYLLVAYNLNTGLYYSVMLDIYIVTNSSTAPVLYNTINLSNIGIGRISMDCHKKYGVAIAWESNDGIQVIAGNAGTWGNVMTLAGTQDEMTPDIAFSHANGAPLNIHFVYYNPNINTLTESVLDWNTLLTTLSGNINPNIEDMNPLTVGSGQTIFQRYVWPVIDCPDHYATENWAYTYTYGYSDYLNMEGIFVRHSSPAGVSTTNVADGSIGSYPCLHYSPISPTLYYGEGDAGNSLEHIFVGWYDQPNTVYPEGKFTALQIDADGNLISNPDYLVISNPVNSFDVSTTPMNWLYDFYINLISFSKMSDPGISPVYLYANYFYSDGATSYNYHLNHVFHKWGDVAFKGPNNTAVQPAGQHSDNISISPNPANNYFKLQLDKSINKFTIKVTSVDGKIVLTQNGSGMNASVDISRLASGMYFVEVSDGVSKSVQRLVKE